MIRTIKNFVRSMTADTENSAQMLADTLRLQFRKASTKAERTEVIRNYLQTHYQRSRDEKVADFPLSNEWINTTQPLSIYRDLKGKLVLLDFFTYCCINCMHILPDLEVLENKYSVEDGLVVIGVHSAKFTNEKQLKNVESAVKRYGIHHAVVNDSEGVIWKSFDTHCWPTLVLIGPESELLFSVQGEGHLELLDCFIGTALSFMKEKNLIKNHALPQITITEELKSFGILSFPGKVATYHSEKGNLIAVSDTGHNRIVILDDKGIIKYVVGSGKSGLKDGNFVNCQFNCPQGIIYKNEEILYVADTENHAIREINLPQNTVKTVAGTGRQGDDRIGGKFWNEQEISSPWDLCFGKNTNVLLIAMAGTHQIWALYLDDDDVIFKKGKAGECKAIAGSGREENRNNLYPHAAAFAQPSGLSFCPERNAIFIADSESSAVRELNLDTGKVTGIVGGSRNPSDLFAFGDIDGVGSDTKLQHPLGVTWHADRNKIYVADSYNHKIKEINLADNSCASIKLDSKLNEPGGLCIWKNQLLIADTNNHCIKLCDLNSLKVTEFSITEFTQPSAESTDKEKNVEISKNGGKLQIHVKLNKPDTVSFTEDAPAFWNVKFTDDESNPLLSNMRLKLNLESDFSVDLPQYSEKSHIKILLNGSAYFCRGDTCTMSDINFLINVNYIEHAAENVSCKFIHDIE